MKKGAVISDCGQYRYALYRAWASPPLCVFIMLNPSTADADLDDPTIRRCVSFAQREACGGLWVVNLFAFRATEPKDMKAASDPIGPDNSAALEKTLLRARMCGYPVIAAWGAHGTYKAADVFVAELAKKHQITLQCFGVTGAGQPKHPLYIKADAPLIEWTGPER